jgi:AraC-like DNA-binding protein
LAPVSSSKIIVLFSITSSLLRCVSLILSIAHNILAIYAILSDILFMLNDFLITRDVLDYLTLYLNSRQEALPVIETDIEQYRQRQHMSYEQWWALLDKLASMDQTPALGLEIGKLISVKDCGVLGYLFKTSRNIGDALKCFKRFQGLIYAGSQADLKVIDDQCVALVWEPDYGYSSQISDALLLSAMINIVRELVYPQKLNLSSVHFTQTIPEAELPIYKAFFQCEIKIRQTRLSLSFSRSDLSLSIPHVDTTLHNILGQQAQELLKHLPESDDFLVRLRDTLIRCLHEGIADAKVIARQMGLSERTLHRRLKEKHRLYRDVLKEIRKSMAIRYLGEPKLTLPEIALLLGYSEQSTFSRAFKEWYGLAPLQYKKRFLL